MSGDGTRTRTSTARTSTSVRANTATRTATTHDDGNPLIWILVLPLFAACLAMALIAVRHDTAVRAEWAS